MIPFGNDTVTIIRRVENVVDNKTTVGYKSERIERCTWRRVALARRVDRQIERGEEIVCRMPPDAHPVCGDVIVLGTVKTAPKDSAELDALLTERRLTGAMRITSVADNTRPGFPLPHYAVRGELP